MKKLDRYHIEVFVPDWARNSILDFTKHLKGIKLIYSKHAIHKIRRIPNPLKKSIKALIESLDISNEIYLDYIFEFYSVEESIKRVCYRFPMKEFNVDIILVISVTGVIVTIYSDHNLDKHRTLNKELYMGGNMSAKLVLSVRDKRDDIDFFESIYILQLILSLPNKKYILWESQDINSEDQEMYLSSLDLLFNEAKIVKLGLGFEKFIIDESISSAGETMDCGSDGILSYVGKLSKYL